MRMKKLSIEEREELLRELLVKLHRGVIHEGDLLRICQSNWHQSTHLVSNRTQYCHSFNEDGRSGIPAIWIEDEADTIELGFAKTGCRSTG